MNSNWIYKKKMPRPPSKIKKNVKGFQLKKRDITKSKKLNLKK